MAAPATAKDAPIAPGQPDLPDPVKSVAPPRLTVADDAEQHTAAPVRPLAPSEDPAAIAATAPCLAPAAADEGTEAQSQLKIPEPAASTAPPPEAAPLVDAEGTVAPGQPVPQEIATTAAGPAQEAPASVVEVVAVAGQPGSPEPASTFGAFGPICTHACVWTRRTVAHHFEENSINIMHQAFMIDALIILALPSARLRVCLEEVLCSSQVVSPSINMQEWSAIASRWDSRRPATPPLIGTSHGKHRRNFGA